MKPKYIITLLVAALALGACSKMNDNIDQYLSQGEIIYLAKPDSVHLYAGKERFKTEFWVSDPRVTEMRIYWAQRSDSIVVNIDPDHVFAEPIVVIADKGIAEGQYSLTYVTYDNLGNKSVPEDENVSVYGDMYQASLNNRLVDSKSVSGNKLTINWGNCYSAQEIGIRVSYTDTAGAAKVVEFDTETLGKSSVIDGVDTTKEVSYVTVYRPEPTAIDVFTTPETVIEL